MLEILFRLSDLREAINLIEYEHYQVDIAAITAKTSEDFKLVLKDFVGKENLLTSFVLRHLLNHDSKIGLPVLYSVTIDSNNYQTLEFPTQGLLQIKINLDNFTVESLQQLITILSARDIHSIVVSGGETITPALLQSFFEQLTTVSLLTLAETFSAELQRHTAEISYRNQLLALFRIKNTSNLWKSLISNWLQARTDRVTNARYEENVTYLADKTPPHSFQVFASRAEPVWRQNDDFENFYRDYIVTTAVEELGEVFFKNFLENITALQNIPGKEILNKLKLNFNCTQAYLESLTVYFQQQEDLLPFKKLELQLSKEMLSHPSFASLLVVMRDINIQELHLKIDFAEDLESTLIEVMRDRVNYPVIIHCGTHLPALQKLIINNIQKKNQNRLFSVIDISQYSDQKEEKAAAKPAQLNQPFVKKIKLKEVIWHNEAKQNNYDEFIKLEIQHVEQQEVEQQQVLEISVQQEVQTATISTYHGELLGYEDFRNKYSSMIANEWLLYLLKEECFQNLPQAIQYFSPAAALEIAKNISTYVTLNADNLPQNLILKKHEGRLVLDYDPFAPVQKPNVFTPKPWIGLVDPKPVYDVSLSRETVEKWINRKGLFAMICMKGLPCVFNHDYLTNLWIYHGEEGVKYFFASLRDLDSKFQGLSWKLVEYYLKHFPHWDIFLTDKTFIASLQKIKLYSEIKMECLLRFLIYTGSSRHHFATTLEAFEVFWEKVETLCLKAERDYLADDKDTRMKNLIKGINRSYKIIDDANQAAPDSFDCWNTHHHAGGSPVVYIQRYLTILENAANIVEQFQCMGGLILCNYGAYYASKNEGFKLVAKEMQFSPDIRLVQGDNEFNPDAPAYRVTLDTIHRSLQGSSWVLEDAYRCSLSPEERVSEYNPRWHRGTLQQWQSKLRKSWLIKNSSPLLKDDELAKLVAEGNAIPYRKSQFKAPYKLYFQSPVTGLTTFSLDEEPWDVPNQVVYASCWRFMGQQVKRMAYKPCVYAYEKTFGENTFYHVKELYTSLFFISHLDGDVGNGQLNWLYNSISNMKTHEEVINTANQSLLQLFRLDIKLGFNEASVLCDRLTKLNSSEFESSGIDKTNSIIKLFLYMKKNKYAVIDMLSILYAYRYSKWPFVYAVDAAVFMEQDSPEIAIHYKDELLSFSLLINSVDFLYLDKNPPKPAVKDFIRLVKHYFSIAASAPKPNNLDHAIRVLTQARHYFSYPDFIEAAKEILALPELDLVRVEKILKDRGFKLSNTSRALRTNFNSAEVKEILIQMLTVVTTYTIENGSDALHVVQDLNSGAELAINTNLYSLTVPELQQRFEDILKTKNAVLRASFTMMLKPLYGQLMQAIIQKHFKEMPPLEIVTHMKSNISKLTDFVDYSSFEKINRIGGQVETIANLLHEIITRVNFRNKLKEISAVLMTVDYSRYDYEMIYSLYNQLFDLPQLDYYEIINEFLSVPNISNNKDNFLHLLSIIERLSQIGMPVRQIQNIIVFAGRHFGEATLSAFIDDLCSGYRKNNNNVLLGLVLNNLNMTLADASVILKFSISTAESLHTSIHHLFSMLQTERPALLSDFVRELIAIDENIRVQVLEVIARSSVSGRAANNSVHNVCYVKLVQDLFRLSAADINLLHSFFATSTVSAACLSVNLANWDFHKPIAGLLVSMEKLPFGARDLEQQFSVAELERVVNTSRDLKNQTIYTYERRKQLMEAVLFVNAVGLEAGIYQGKPAIDLTNLEIKTLFHAAKDNKLTHLDRFQRMVYALGLMREAMYRVTEEFPFSTQIYALLDSIMHEGDIISNIDMGQGKTLIDTMKGALLWIVSDCVDITTSSLVDAKRQIDLYTPLLELLGIPFTNKAITASSDFSEYKVDGINFGTFAGFALFFSRARVDNYIFNIKNGKVSLVVNESDHAILDDKTIYRYAVTKGNFDHEWIYTAINEFIETDEFKDRTTSDIQDFAALRKSVARYARQHDKSPKIIYAFDDEQLLAWIESAIIVRYVLGENFAYVIPPESALKFINGEWRSTHSVKILMKDGKVSPDTTYGNGIQQLLYAFLNSKKSGKNFVIEPESNTIMSTNNVNLIQRYLSKNGFIWGSSGTVGSAQEIIEQSKYGLSFSEIKPHQKNIVKYAKPVILKNRALHVDAIIKAADNLRKQKTCNTGLIFCKDIESAQYLFNEMQSRQSAEQQELTQLFTGVGNEEHVIRRAAIRGMNTITTSALGRNTNILYLRESGMTVIQTYPDTTRGTDQKGGRTGRQGSEGLVLFYLNEEDLHGKSLEEITAEIDSRSAHERIFNENLYQIIGYMLAVIDRLPAADFPAGKTEFFRNSWSKFTSATEIQYREAKLNNTYDQALFVNDTVREFNRLLQSKLHADVSMAINAADVLAILDKETPVHATYAIDSKVVRIADCTPVSVMAYHFIPEDNSEDILAIGKEDIKKELTEIFTLLQSGTKMDVSKRYFEYIHTYSKCLPIIREAHQEFLADFLSKTVEKAKHNNLFTRFLGLAPKINTIANNRNYLFMFNAIMSMNANKALASCEDLKPLLITMLDQYLQQSWFVNSARKQSVAELKVAINNATNIDELCTVLSEQQTSILSADMAANKSILRRLKPLNFFGSRLQATLSDSLVLLTALAAKDQSAVTNPQLVTQLKSVTKNPAALSSLETDVSFDNLHAVEPKLKFTDKANAQVIKTALNKSLGYHLLFSTPVSMQGRTAEFQYTVRVDEIKQAEHEEKYSESKVMP